VAVTVVTAVLFSSTFAVAVAPAAIAGDDGRVVVQLA